MHLDANRTKLKVRSEIIFGAVKFDLSYAFLTGCEQTKWPHRRRLD